MSFGRLAIDDEVVVKVTAEWLPTLWKGYRHPRVCAAEVPLQELTSVIPAVGQRRLDSAKKFVADHNRNGLRLYESATQDQLDGRVTLAPICEVHSHSVSIIDGLHRVIAASSLGLTKVRVLLVEDECLPELVAEPWTIQNVRIYSGNVPGSPFYQHEMYRSSFRPGEKIAAKVAKEIEALLEGKSE